MVRQMFVLERVDDASGALEVPIAISAERGRIRNLMARRH